MRDHRRVGHPIRPAAPGFVVALVLYHVACSLDGLSDGERSPTDGGLDQTSEASSDGGIPDPLDADPCPGCETIASGEDHPTELRLDARLYWLRGGTTGFVVSSRIDGLDLTFEAEHAIASPHDLILTPRPEAFVVSADGTMLRYLTYSTCTGSTGVQRLAPLGLEFLVVKANGLYRSDCGGGQLMVNEPSIRAVDGDGSYAWYARPNGEIVRCDVSASACATTRTVIASEQGTVPTIVHDASWVFWIAADATQIRGWRKVGAEAVVVLASGRHPTALAPAGGALFWTDIEAGTVTFTEVDTKTSRVIARELAQPVGIAVDATHVYVAESAGGRILRMPRPPR